MISGFDRSLCIDFDTYGIDFDTYGIDFDTYGTYGVEFETNSIISRHTA